MKYPPYSWLRLSDEIRQSPSRMWFAFNKLPLKSETCHVRVHIGGTGISSSDPYEAIANQIIFPREQRVLELFLKMAKPLKSKNEFVLDHASFGMLLPFSAAIPFEIMGVGVISFARQNARITASLNHPFTRDANIQFSLETQDGEAIKKFHLFGDVNAHVIDEDLKLYLILPNLTESEAEAILTSPHLPLLGLCQKESRQMFYALSRLGIDFSCLNQMAKPADKSQIVLRLLLNTDPATKKMCARAHLVTELTLGEFSDEVEIKSTSSIPAFHILASEHLDEEKYADVIDAPTLLQRPSLEEQTARNFLYQLGASPARLHDGFELVGDDAFLLLKAISEKGRLPDFIKLDEYARPNIIELGERLTLRIVASVGQPKRVDVAISISEDFDKTKADFHIFSKARDNILVLDEENLVVLNPKILATIAYFSETLGIDGPQQFKSKSIAQIALLLNSFKGLIDVDAAPELAGYLENFSITEQTSDRHLPEGLLTTLRPYQHDAVAWLSALHRSGLGGLLGDEMGLGKTLMVLTHLARLKESGQSKKPALVVCPTSVIDVWKEEARIHIPSLCVMKWHGPEREQKLKDLHKADIVITSYAILRRDFNTKLNDFSFSTLVLDEAQYVRNQQTDSFKVAKAINCDHRIALTGTPIENHLSDLYNILDCTEEGILGSRTRFERQFVNPIEAGHNDSAISLKLLLAPIVTRRRKKEVESELPPKIESVVHCKLSSQQKELYKKYVNQMSSTILAHVAPDLSLAKVDTHFSLLSALTRLRQICCHPSLILGKDVPDEQSGKLVALREIMTECLELGRKIIIYSQFLKMQEHIVKLAQELHEQGALWLHGSTQNREEIVKTFQSEEGPRIIVVSLKAGGTGITLTQADTVIFADPWWNPAVEDQAVDRAHRIGQKKTVHVIRIIAEESIEGEVVALAQRKRRAAQSVLHEGFKSSANLTKDEVRGLLLREIDRVKPSSAVEEFEEEFPDFDYSKDL